MQLESRIAIGLAGLLLSLGLSLTLVADPVDGVDAERVLAGKNLVQTRSKGNCLACHEIGDGELPGNLGPPLMAMPLRFPERDVLREQIWDPTLRNPDSRMPPFGKHGILSEDEIDLILDYLYTL